MIRIALSLSPLFGFRSAGNDVRETHLSVSHLYGVDQNVLISIVLHSGTKSKAYNRSYVTPLILPIGTRPV